MMKLLYLGRLERNKGWILGTCLFGFLLSVGYSNTFQSPPVLDDFHSFIDEPLTKVDHWSTESILSLSQTKFGWARWIPMLSFSWDIWFGRGEFFYLHLTNMVIHFLCLLAAIFLVNKILESNPSGNASCDSLFSPIEIACFISAIWALNPVQTSTVTYLVQRMTSLMALFYLLSMGFYFSARSAYRKSSTIDGRVGVYAGLSLAAMVMALLSKENSLMLPFMMICSEIWLFQNGLHRRLIGAFRQHKLQSVIALLLLASAALMILLHMNGGYQGRNFTMPQRLLTEARVLVWYLSLVIWPDPGRLSVEHHVAISTSILNPPTTFFSIVFLGVLLWWTISKRKRYPVVSYGLLWFFLNLLIESTIVPLELVFEHRMYLPSLGLILSLVVLLHGIVEERFRNRSARDLRILGWCMVLILSSVLTLATFDRNETWSDPVTLNRDDALKHPQSPRTHGNLAVALARTGQHEEAIREAYFAIHLGEKNYEVYTVAVNTIVASKHESGDYQGAVDEGERLLRERPDYVNAYSLPSICLNMARSHMELGNFDLALKSVQQALIYNQRLTMRMPELESACVRAAETILKKAQEKGSTLLGDGIQPGQPGVAKRWIAVTLLAMGDRNSAKRVLLEAVDEEHDNESKAVLEAMAQEGDLNRIQESKRSFWANYVLHPFSRFNVCMAVAYLAWERPLPPSLMKVGESFLDYAAKLQPESADVHLLKGWYYYQRKDAHEAVAEARQALMLDPEYARAWLGLGFFLAEANNPQEAINAFQKVLELYPGYPQRLAIMDIIADLKTKSSSLAQDENVRTN